MKKIKIQKLKTIHFKTSQFFYRYYLHKKEYQPSPKTTQNILFIYKKT